MWRKSAAREWVREYAGATATVRHDGVCWIATLSDCVAGPSWCMYGRDTLTEARNAADSHLAWQELCQANGTVARRRATPEAIGYDEFPYSAGNRVEIHPATDLWMRGARYGTCERISEDGRKVLVRLDKVAKPVNFTAESFRRVF